MKRFQRSIAIHASALLFVVFACPLSRATDYRGDQFIGCDRFGSFSKTQDADGSEVLTSRPLPAAIRFDELVASWDADMPDGASLKVEARALHNDHATKYYTMGIWSADADRSPRESVSRQKDSDGNVSTDTLSLTEPADHFQIRLTLSPAGKDLPDLKYLGVCLTDTHAHLDPLPPNKAAWGKVLPVPEKSQIAYPNGHVICSATTTS
ncbi:MAG TPA: hypothetical protein VHH88_09195, partial [Verrucomicrobiae bacterium]|nr:hypothetical protein [Verrucomicrobiae bacterium]